MTAGKREREREREREKWLKSPKVAPMNLPTPTYFY
jgi:hypothetical protein